MKVSVDLSTFNLDAMYSQAIKNNYPDNFKELLIELGANPNPHGVSMKDILTMTPGEVGRVFVKELKKTKPNIKIIDNILEHSAIDMDAWHTIPNAGPRIWNSHDFEDFGGTVLDIAHRYKHWDIVYKILQHENCDPTEANIDKIFKDACEVREDIAKLLLKYAHPSSVISVLLNHIIKEENIMLFIQRSDIDINKKNKFGETLLIRASMFGYTEIVKLLLERTEIKVNLKDKEGKTALIWALERGHTEIVKLLLERPETKVYGKT